LKRFLYRYVLPYIGFIIVKLLFFTYRIRVLNPEIEENIYKRGEVPIYASWHQRLFIGTSFLAKRHIAVMISLSKDGDLIAKIVKMLGLYPVRGSSSKNGIEALRNLKRIIKDGVPIGHIVDGPKGPAREIKVGLLLIAKYSGMPILPIIISTEKKWCFNSWDRFIIPKPFSRIVVKFDKEIYIPKKMNRKKFLEIKISLENRFTEIYQETDKIWLE